MGLIPTNTTVGLGGAVQALGESEVVGMGCPERAKVGLTSA